MTLNSSVGGAYSSCSNRAYVSSRIINVSSGVTSTSEFLLIFCIPATFATICEKESGKYASVVFLFLNTFTTISSRIFMRNSVYFLDFSSQSFCCFFIRLNAAFEKMALSSLLVSESPLTGT